MIRNKSIRTILWLGLSVIVVELFSCKGGEDCNVPCYFGACSNNSCNCNPGYEGDSCTILTTEKFIGSWLATDSCVIDNFGYTATIAASSTIANTLQITNLGEFGTNFIVEANVSGFTFTIPTQTVEGITLSGSGVVDTVAKTIVVSYDAKETGTGKTDACSGLWFKQ